ncbi:hypothetical protein QYG06_17900 [Xanthomonas euvesicatoria]|uniref:Uncharacterized protein n=5 Tax=Xanthomonas TaxID=338 RepID=A0A6V7FKK0_9XANT|nr:MULTISPECIES: hypothetical protein [Xanthomonas]MBB5672860.1 hypothetical protein [Xanthomonas arboricola]MBZ3284111.1 hypothetical protein [Xanthomonas perforans]MCC8581737.1 hypothetical protein [Xanthomonas euvesicatoria pv. euvesicatoria]MCC8586237.1 hypothetical protein [Xanthomonas euvesicatoria pv. euvesicatoria]MCC8590672.1 hypothetical protein [Xanthomonas euvesicatoria pv. euvesicatoria]
MAAKLEIEKEREAVARAVCLACEEVPDHIGDAQGNAHRWQDYLPCADAAIAAFTSHEKGQQASHAVPPAAAPVQVEVLHVSGVPEACKHCGGTAFEWFAHKRAASDVVDGRLRTHEVQCSFVLGCLDCSETLMVVAADTIAGMLSTRSQ